MVKLNSIAYKVKWNLAGKAQKKPNLRLFFSLACTKNFSHALFFPILSNFKHHFAHKKTSVKAHLKPAIGKETVNKLRKKVGG